MAENMDLEVYVVGGYVRDIIIGNNLSDIDIMVVGDDSQAIYAFRGSKVEYIWEFENNFKCLNSYDLGKYLLETNYRSTPSIINFFFSNVKFTGSE